MTSGKDILLGRIRKGEGLSLGQQIKLCLMLSYPAILAQLSSVMMQYIDASMVGHLGPAAGASIGLVSTCLWLFGGFGMAVTSGFSVQVAHRVGAGDFSGARSVLRQALVCVLGFSLFLSVVGMGISPFLPHWLGGGPDITENASAYFFIFALTIPLMQLYYLAGGMLRCSGNMLVPSLVNVGACALDVVMNMLFIFPTREVTLWGFHFNMPGLGLGVVGAALGTTVAFAISVLVMLSFLCMGSKELRLTHERGSFRPERRTLERAVKIGSPMMLQHVAMCSAQIVTTIIVAPLGTFAIAANAFGITAESLCYMPGYGIAEAATTLVGQSLGAGRADLMRRFATITVGTGMVVMSLMGVVMYVAAPLMMGILTPVPEVHQLGVECLRIEAWAEPMFAAAIVSYSVFVGAGDTLKPSIMNLGSIWAVRLSLAALLAPSMGLHGVWLAMCIELCFRGLIFLVQLYLKMYGPRRWGSHTSIAATTPATEAC